MLRDWGILKYRYGQMKRTEIACQFHTLGIHQGENTSTTMISSAYYEKYSLPQLQEQSEYIHSQDQIFVLHMCGLLKNLLHLIKQVGIEGIHSLVTVHRVWMGDNGSYGPSNDGRG